MIQFTVTLSDSLVRLIETNQAPIDGIEVGPYFSPERYKQYRAQFKDHKFYYHGIRVPSSSQELDQFKAFLNLSDNTWASAHLALIPSYAVWLGMRYKFYPPVPGVDGVVRQLMNQVARLNKVIDRPLLLENMPSFPTKRYHFEADPLRISTILKTTKCNLLLDISHARTAASIRGMDVYDYLNSLPLNKVVQIHMSGPRMRGVCLYDAHEPLQEIDYVILEWVLAQTKPLMVTLEYLREREALQKQILQLRQFLTAHESTSTR